MTPLDEWGRPLAVLLGGGVVGWHVLGFLRWDRQRRREQAHQDAMRALRRASSGPRALP